MRHFWLFQDSKWADTTPLQKKKEIWFAASSVFTIIWYLFLFSVQKIDSQFMFTDHIGNKVNPIYESVQHKYQYSTIWYSGDIKLSKFKCFRVYLKWNNKCRGQCIWVVTTSTKFTPEKSWHGLFTSFVLSLLLSLVQFEKLRGKYRKHFLNILRYSSSNPVDYCGRESGTATVKIQTTLWRNPFYFSLV